MIGAHRSLINFLRDSLHDSPIWPKPLHLIQGALLVAAGEPVAAVAKQIGTSVARLTEVASREDPVAAVLKVADADLEPAAIDKLRRNVGQLVLGRAAEIAFEEICRGEIDVSEFELSDLREGRTNIVVHVRGTDEFNTLVLELKTGDGSRACDIRKLQLLTDSSYGYGYQLGAFLRFNGQEDVEIVWFPT